jgi:hypothetical protein
MRRKILLLLAVSMCASIGGGIAEGLDESAPERNDDAFL